MQPGPHAVLPAARADDIAREGFLRAMRRFVVADMFPACRGVYDTRARPGFIAKSGHEPVDRRDVKDAFAEDPFFRAWCALHRTTQLLLWNTVGESVEAQLPGLIERARAVAAEPAGAGSLTLDPALTMPRYMDAVDIHVMPGNFHGETGPDGDVFAGAMYDRGVHVFSIGGLGPYCDALGHVTGAAIKEEFPTLRPRRILDMGCSIGHSTLALAEEFPDAEMHALDLSAPMMRYAHARARSLGKAVHFRQADARHTGYPDGHFDLVVSQIMLHEMPVPVIGEMLVEAHRLLAPGGVTLHNDGLGVPKDPYDDYVGSRWAQINNEPFGRAASAMDFHGAAVRAGFAPQDVFAKSRPPAYLKEQIRIIGLRGAVKPRG